MENFRLKDRSRQAMNGNSVNDAFEDIVGASRALREVLDLVRTVAPTNSTALIEGETGTSKEIIARAIHEHSTRRDRRFVKLNCAAIPLGLLKSELFGHERGAFTGAVARSALSFSDSEQRWSSSETYPCPPSGRSEFGTTKGEIS